MSSSHAAFESVSAVTGGVADLRAVNPRARIGVKLVAGGYLGRRDAGCQPARVPRAENRHGVYGDDGQEAVGALVSYAIGTLGAEVVRAYADADNVSSIRVAEKVGMRRSYPVSGQTYSR